MRGAASSVTCCTLSGNMDRNVPESIPGYMAAQLNSICDELVQAVTIMMEPQSPQGYREQALKFCEEFKEKCPHCVSCGLQLAEKTRAPVIRHFGLQVLEHVVKFRWNSMKQEEKVLLKSGVINLILTGIHTIMEEEAHIKDVLARIMVEMIKREWPQNWSGMLNELDTFTKTGEVQTELVMFILLRLAEDVVTFQSLPTQRRRDILSAMTLNMEKLFTFILNILQGSVHAYKQLKTDPLQTREAQGMCRVAVSALNTLAGYIDWVCIRHITQDSCKLLEVLCQLLSEPELQVEAAECLLIAVSRKGKLEDRIPLMVLFGDQAMGYLISAAQMVDNDIPLEKRYVFLKRLCQVLCGMGNQLCALSLPPTSFNKPVNFSKYLDSLLGFTRHPSQFIRYSTLMSWGSFFRNKVLSQEPELLAVVPEFLRISMTNIIKVGFPSKNDSPSCIYSRIDFDSDEDFSSFFCITFRGVVGDQIRAACRVDPLSGFNIAAEWLRYQVSVPLDFGTRNNSLEDEQCNLLSPSFIQWDAMTFFCESVTSQLFKMQCKEDLPVAEGIELLQCILHFETKDPLILSCVLSSLLTFFPFVSYRSELLPPLLEKLFAAITFDIENDSKFPRKKSVKNLRRNTCSSIIKICKLYPEIILTHFQLMYNYVRQVVNEKRLLTQLERCSCIEAIVLVSNKFANYERQRTFLAELFSPILSIWLSEEVQRAFVSREEFISFVGADMLTESQVETDLCRMTRGKLYFCIYSILGTLKRAHWPKNPEEAKAGGFVVAYGQDGSPIYRNPCSEQVLKILDGVLAFIRTYNSMFLPEFKLKMGETFCKTLDMLDSEKTAILGISQSALDLSDASPYKTDLDWIQGFMAMLYDSCYQIVGCCGASMQQDFFSIPDLATRLVSSAFSNLESVPLYRLRPILRLFVKPLVLSCPPEQYESLMCPILGPLFSYLYQRLSHDWACFNNRELVSDDDYTEGSVEYQEIVDDQLVRVVTREVVELLVTCCITKKKADSVITSTGVDGVCNSSQADMDDDEMMATESAVDAGSLELTELGKVLIAREDISAAVMISAFSPLLWKDSVACNRAAAHLCWPLLKQVVSDSFPSEAAVCFFTNVLRSLQIHGQHKGCSDALITLAFHIYETLRPRYAELHAVMKQVPDLKPDLLNTFDAKLLVPVQRVGEKKRRDNFKNLIHGCIGKPLCEQFKKEVHIRNLPSLFQKKPRQIQEEDPIMGSCAESLTALFQP
ncbi:exportin-5 [Bombina bombina]|uniref:exportin-5 n=1 Tax=Bombina bombina TaxID=8345 RepID=UPI00235A8C53|nr:exportin-5 [Bombina bombina]